MRSFMLCARRAWVPLSLVLACAAFSGARLGRADEVAIHTEPAVVAEEAREHGDTTVRAEAKIRAALHDPTTIEFTETPLSDALDYLRELHHINIQFDERAIGEQGVAPDTVITRNLRGISLHSALAIILRDLQLTSVVTDGVLLITTPSAVEGMIETRVYRDVVPAGGDLEKVAALVRSLLAAKESKSTVLPFEKLLIVRGSLAEHEELEKLIAQLQGN